MVSEHKLAQNRKCFLLRIIQVSENIFNANLSTDLAGTLEYRRTDLAISIEFLDGPEIAHLSPPPLLSQYHQRH